MAGFNGCKFVTSMYFNGDKMRTLLLVIIFLFMSGCSSVQQRKVIPVDVKEYIVIEVDGDKNYLIEGTLVSQGNRDQLLDAISDYESKKIFFGCENPFPTFQALPAMIILDEYGYEYYVWGANGSIEQLSLSVE